MVRLCFDRAPGFGGSRLLPALAALQLRLLLDQLQGQGQGQGQGCCARRLRLNIQAQARSVRLRRRRHSLSQYHLLSRKPCRWLVVQLQALRALQQPPLHMQLRYRQQRALETRARCRRLGAFPVAALELPRPLQA